MSKIEIVASTNNVVTGVSSSYSTARSTATNLYTAQLDVGQAKVSGNYYVVRGFLRFDTSGIPSYAKVCRANLRLAIKTDSSNTDFDVQILEHDWSAYYPITSGNRDNVFDECLSITDYFLWKNTNGLSVDTTYIGETMNAGYVNKTGYTYYSIRSSRDKSENEPSGYENLEMHYITSSLSLRPTLMIEYLDPKKYYSFLKNNRRPM